MNTEQLAADPIVEELHQIRRELMEEYGNLENLANALNAKYAGSLRIAKDVQMQVPKFQNLLPR